MEVRIGVVYTARELTVETDDSVDGVTAAIEGAMTNGDSLLWLTDRGPPPAGSRNPCAQPFTGAASEVRG